ncbi:PREDICTED: GDNF family receptor alpha-4 [Colobus angolensis palliatus]|uniref:GDNF family receptor alpha-4 n=1 Tax=Colobus angolensis palliatus TaxID=336983 RepID=UPI0005F3AE6C|nr:PREDICTED: GDNF family receptor alpha-4 [Colobus angolensis palliatus]
MVCCLGLVLLLLLLGSVSSAGGNRCVDAAEACTADAQCQRLRSEYVRCLRAYAGLVGTAVTPNYVDNVSARVAPWCDCGASGNRREDCEAFRGLFTRNRCLDGAIQAFARGWPPVLLDPLNPQGDPEHSLLQVSSAVRALEGGSLLSILPVLALPALL